MPCRRRLSTSAAQRLDINSTPLATVGDRAFPVAAARVWNSLPDDVTAAASTVDLRRRLKTHLFRIAYLDFC
jgi:hypothetical protein